MKHSLGVRVINSLLAIMFLVSTTPLPAAESPAKTAAAASTVGASSPEAAKAGESGWSSQALTLGFLTGNDVTESYGDLLLPFYLSERDMIFFNPRVSGTDEAEREFNLGFGYRHLLGKNGMILGANVFYDNRETESDFRYDQMGIGVEVLSKWVDARANIYIPNDEKNMVNSGEATTVSTEVSTRQTESTSTRTWADEPEPTGNLIVQDYYTETLRTIRTYRTTTVTTTTETYEQFEAPLEGWDMEIGLRMPLPEKGPELRLFGGYYSFDGECSEKVEGFKARAELRAVPLVTLDATWYEDSELFGGEWFVGARVNLPLDLANLAKGRNPFRDSFKGMGARSLASRMNEMVIRDMRVRTTRGEYELNQSKTETTTSASTETTARTSRTIETDVITLMNGLLFVDMDNASDPYENGSYEHPFDHIQEGVNAWQGTGFVYVFDAAGTYNENVILKNGITVWGNGATIFHPDVGRVLGGGAFPVVDGRSQGPAVNMADNSTLVGMQIQNTSVGGQEMTIPLPSVVLPDNASSFVATPSELESSMRVERVGVLANGVNNFTIQGNRIVHNEVGIALVKDGGDFSFRVLENEASYNDSYGLVVYGGGDLVTPVSVSTPGSEIDPGGAFVANVTANSFRGNGYGGMRLTAAGYDTAELSIFNNTADGNGESAHDTFSLHVPQYVLPAGAGFELDVFGTREIFAQVRGNTARENAGAGMVALFAASSSVVALFSDMILEDNDAGGLFASMEATGEEGGMGLALGVFADIQANWNGWEMLNPAAGTQDAFPCPDVEPFGAGVSAYISGDVAAGLFFSSSVASGLMDAHALDISGLLDGFGIPRFSSSHGMEASNNGGDGIDVTVMGDEVSVLAMLGVTAHGNGDMYNVTSIPGGSEVLGDSPYGDGVHAEVVADNGLALALMADVHSDRNYDDGVDVSVTEGNDVGSPPGPQPQSLAVSPQESGILGDGIAAAVLVDVNASENLGNGIRGAVSSDGTAVALVASSGALMDVGSAALNGEFDIDIPDHSAYLPSRMDLSGNGLNGLSISVYGDAAAMLGVLGVNAEDNGWAPRVLSQPLDAGVLNGRVGRGILAYVTSEAGTAEIGMARIDVSRNVTDGIYVEGSGDEEVLAAFVDINAVGQEEGNGVYVGLSSGSIGGTGEGVSVLGLTTDNSTPNVGLIMVGVNASSNGTDGIAVDLAAQASLSGCFSSIVANDNEGDGLQIHGNAGGDADIWVGGEGSLADALAQSQVFSSEIPEWLAAFLPEETACDFSRNTDAGLDVDVTAGGSVKVGIMDVRALGNNIGVNLSTSSGLPVPNVALISDVDVQEPEPYDLHMHGCSVFSNTTFDVQHTANGRLNATSNWWGSAPPVPGKFSTTNFIDYSDWLSFNPLP